MAALRGRLDEDDFQWASTLVAWADRQGWSSILTRADPLKPAVENEPVMVQEPVRQAIAGLVRRLAGQRSNQEVDPFERIRARREQLARFQTDPGRIARPS